MDAVLTRHDPAYRPDYMGVLIVVAGPPLPGRCTLARALRQRLGARGRSAVGAAADGIGAALTAGDVVVVDGELRTAAERQALWECAAGHARRFVEWGCARPHAEREIFHRYASRPPSVAEAELARYEEHQQQREPLGGELGDEELVQVAADQPLDAQLRTVLERLPATRRSAPGRQRALRIMVVEDDADQRAMLTEVLEELGFDVVEPAASGNAALARLDAGADVDVLISDQRMPGMSGIELTQALAERHPGVRAILLTAFGDEETCQQALQARAVTVLAKPLRVMDLSRVLEEATV
jgi:CheY-like chemotaxis protein/predicted kinase